MKVIFLVSAIIVFSVARAQKSELLLQKGHSNRINTIVFSPKSTFFATGADDNLILLTDVSTGINYKTLAGHTEAVKKIVFTVDGKKMISGSKEEIIVWNLETETKLFSYREEGIDNFKPAGAVNAAGTLFVFKGQDGREYKMNLTNGEVEELKLPGMSDIEQFEFTADGKFLLVITEKSVYVLDSKTFDQVFLFGTQQMPKAYFITRDGKYYYCANPSCNWQRWDLTTGKMTESRRGRKNSVEELSDNGFIVVNNEHTIMAVYDRNELSFFDLWNGSLLKSTKFEIDNAADKRKSVKFSAAALSFSGDVYAAAATLKEEDKPDIQRVQYIDTKSGRIIRETKGFLSSVSKVSVSPDDRHLAVLPWEDDKQVARIWEMDKAGGRLFPLDLSTRFTKNINWSADSKVVVTDQTMTDLGTGDFHGITGHFKFGSDAMLGDNVISSDFSRMAGKQRILSFKTGQPQCIIDTEKDFTSTNFTNENENGNIYGTKVFLPDNKTLLVFRPDNKNLNVNIYDVNNCNKTGIFTIETAYHLEEDDQLEGAWMVSKSGKYFVMGSNGVYFYDIAKQEKIGEIAPLNNETNTFGSYQKVNSLAMNAQENMLAVAYVDTTITLFEFPSGKKLRTLKGHDIPATSVCFKNNADILISAGPDSKIIFWSSATGEQLGTMAAIDSTEFIITTPEGYYFATRGALKNVAFRSNKKIFPFEQFDLKYNRPDKVFKKLELANDKQTKMYNLAYQKRLKKAGFTEEMLGSDFHLPEAEVNNKYQLPFVKYDDTLGFTLTASDNLYGLARINVYVNDVAVYGSTGMTLPGNPKKLNKKLNLVLSTGLNHIQVSVTNEKGVESMREVFDVNCEMEKKPDLYMLVVGVSEFKESERNLKYASKDATDLANAFRNSNRFGKVVIKEIKNYEATKENILKAAEMFKGSKEDDLVILHMSSHGVMDANLDYYLATANMTFANPAENGLLYTELEKSMEKAPSRNRLMLIDACHSGEVDKEEIELAQKTGVSENANVKLVTRAGNYAVTPRLGLSNSFAYMQTLFDDVSKGMGATVIAAAGGMEYALESSEWNNGVFTYSVLSGLKNNAADFNKDGIIRIDELKAYVTNMVIELTAGRQVPNARKENLNNNFIIK